MNNRVIAPVIALHEVEMPIPVHIANREALWEGIGGHMPSQSEVALPVAKEDSHVIEPGCIYRDVQVAVLIKIAGHEHLRQD